jgi:hypothetical protein
MELPTMDFYSKWDDRCSRILRANARSSTNRQIAAAIEAETGKHFTVFTVSRRRARLGLAGGNRNDWSAAITRWRIGRARRD